jgi:hypothetical protein
MQSQFTQKSRVAFIVCNVITVFNLAESDLPWFPYRSDVHHGWF